MRVLVDVALAMLNLWAALTSTGFGAWFFWAFVVFWLIMCVVDATKTKT